jgi:hypothetical protein
MISPFSINGPWRTDIIPVLPLKEKTTMGITNRQTALGFPTDNRGEITEGS